MNYTVAEFRKNIRAALDLVAEGEEVFITRHNKTFAIIKAPFNYLSDDGKSHNIRPDTVGITPPEKINSGATPQLTTIEAMPHHKTDPVPDPFSGEMACCVNPRKRCQHWQLADNGEAWVNSLSGKEREVEA